MNIIVEILKLSGFRENPALERPEITVFGTAIPRKLGAYKSITRPRTRIEGGQFDLVIIPYKVIHCILISLYMVYSQGHCPPTIRARGLHVLFHIIHGSIPEAWNSFTKNIEFSGVFQEMGVINDQAYHLPYIKIQSIL